MQGPNNQNNFSGSDMSAAASEGGLESRGGLCILPPASLSYRLVTVDGRPYEGPQAGQTKHPFGLTRVYYDSKVGMTSSQKLNEPVLDTRFQVSHT